MKRKIVLIIIITINVAAKAQISRKSFLIGNQIFMSYENKHTPTSDRMISYRLSFSPHIGYFAFKNLALGIKEPLYYENTKTHYKAISIDGSYHSFSYNIGPFIRYYIGREKLFFVTEINANYSNITNKGDQIDPITGSKSVLKTRETNSNVTVSGGIAYFINSNVSLECVLSYIHQKNYYYYTDSKIMSNKLYINLGFEILLNSINREK